RRLLRVPPHPAARASAVAGRDPARAGARRSPDDLRAQSPQSADAACRQHLRIRRERRADRRRCDAQPHARGRIRRAEGQVPDLLPAVAAVPPAARGEAHMAATRGAVLDRRAPVTAASVGARICLALLLLVPIGVYWPTVFHEYGFRDDYAQLREARD